MLVGHLVDEQVVNERAPRGHQARVLCPPDHQLGGVVAGHELNEVERPLSRDLDLAHVRDVEQPHPRADGTVLLDHAGVLHRHLETRERHDARLRLEVAFIQGGPLQMRVGHPALPAQARRL
jgi:hypothetical protein